jgi:exopolysaccharide biosynthesis protein
MSNFSIRLGKFSKPLGVSLVSISAFFMLLGAPDAVIPQASAAGDSLDYHSEQVGYDGKNYTVQWVSADLSDPYLRVKPVTASGGIGHVESFSDMMDEHQAAAGVNGTFFDAYEPDETSRYPNGLMIRAGNIVRTGENASFGILADKTTLVQKTKLSLSVKVTHQGESYTFSPWGVNTYYGSGETDQVLWFTPDFGAEVAYPGGTKIVISEHQIIQITTDTVAIPEDGQVCFIGHSNNNLTYLLPELHVGDKVSAAPHAVNMVTGKEIPFSEWEAAIGAGPVLVSNGEVDVDYKRDGFNDPKITSQAGARSFIGTDAEGRLVIGTTSSATIDSMAQVLQQLGFQNAMNLDGGASSALYYDGSMLRAPGRELSNALIIERLEHPQVQIEVNGQLVDEFRGFIQNDTTMVPFRGIFERIDASFRWDGTTRTLSATKGKTTLVLQPDVALALVNGKSVALQIAPTIVDGHIYIPLRFIAETLGATVGWNQQLYRATLAVPKK